MLDIPHPGIFPFIFLHPNGKLSSQKSWVRFRFGLDHFLRVSSTSRVWRCSSVSLVSSEKGLLKPTAERETNWKPQVLYHGGTSPNLLPVVSVVDLLPVPPKTPQKLGLWLSLFLLNLKFIKKTHDTLSNKTKYSYIFLYVSKKERRTNENQ